MLFLGFFFFLFSSDREKDGRDGEGGVHAVDNLIELCSGLLDGCGNHCFFPFAFLQPIYLLAPSLKNQAQPLFSHPPRLSKVLNLTADLDIPLPDEISVINITGVRAGGDVHSAGRCDCLGKWRMWVLVLVLVFCDG